jgi:hypothetical protein
VATASAAIESVTVEERTDTSAAGRRLVDHPGRGDPKREQGRQAYPVEQPARNAVDAKPHLAMRIHALINAQATALNSPATADQQPRHRPSQSNHLDRHTRSESRHLTLQEQTRLATGRAPATCDRLLAESTDPATHRVLGGTDKPSWTGDKHPPPHGRYRSRHRVNLPAARCR